MKMNHRFVVAALASMFSVISLTAQAQPKPLLDELADLQREALDPWLREDTIGPRPTSAYQHLLSPEEPVSDETPSEEKNTDETDGDPQPV